MKGYLGGGRVGGSSDDVLDYYYFLVHVSLCFSAVSILRVSHARLPGKERRPCLPGLLESSGDLVAIHSVPGVPVNADVNRIRCINSLILRS